MVIPPAVLPDGRDGRGERGGRDRGQLILVGAITIALTFVGLVVILNSTLYAQNVSPGNSLDDAEEVEKYERIVEKDMQRLARELNESEGRIEKRTVEESLAFYSARMAEQTADRKPAYVDASLNATTSNTTIRIGDDDAEAAHIYAKDGSNHWTLAENVSDAETFDMTLEPQDAGQPFRVLVTDDDGDEWRLGVNRDPPSGSVVEVQHADGTVESCTAGETAEIDLLAGTVNGTDCFAFAPNVDGPYAIRFENGNHAGGTYDIVAEGDPNDVESYFYDSAEDGSPYLVEEVTRAVIDVHYETPELSATVPVEVRIREVIEG